MTCGDKDVEGKHEDGEFGSGAAGTVGPALGVCLYDQLYPDHLFIITRSAAAMSVSGLPMKPVSSDVDLSVEWRRVLFPQCVSDEWSLLCWSSFGIISGVLSFWCDDKPITVYTS